MNAKNKIALLLLFSIHFFAIDANEEMPKNNLASTEKEKLFSTEEIEQKAVDSPDRLEEKLKELSKDKDWFIKNELFEKPANEYSTLSSTIKWFPTVLAGTAPLLPLINYFRAEAITHDATLDTFLGRIASKISSSEFGLFSQKNTALMLTLPTCLLLGFITYKLMKDFVSKPINFRKNKSKALENFVKNWNEHKVSTPKNLHKLFDLLHEEYKQQENPTEFIKTFVDNILEKVTSVLPERPTSKLSKTITMLNLGAASILTASFFLSVQKFENNRFRK